MLSGKDSACRSEQRAVTVAVHRALDLPPQDLELVVKHKDLDLCGLIGVTVRGDEGEEPDEAPDRGVKQAWRRYCHAGRCSTTDDSGGAA